MPQSNNLFKLYNDIYEDFKQKFYGKEVKLIDNIDDVVTNSNSFPLIGFHSTTFPSLRNILSNGFNRKSGESWGIQENDPVIAMFSIFFQENYDNINQEEDNITNIPSAYISITNGLLREYRRMIDKYTNIMMRNGIMVDLNTIESKSVLDYSQYPNEDDDEYEAEKWDGWEPDDDYFDFPLIMCCFTGCGKLHISKGWILSYDSKNMHILGYYVIRVKKTSELYSYLDNKQLGTVTTTPVSDLIKNFSYEFIYINNPNNIENMVRMSGTLPPIGDIYRDFSEFTINNGNISKIQEKKAGSIKKTRKKKKGIKEKKKRKSIKRRKQLI
jgi:hypothetical protein